MARIYIPPSLRSLTDGRSVVDVDGTTVIDVINHLDALYPGTKSVLCPDGRLRTGIMVGVDSGIASAGIQERLSPHSEVHFLPALGGGH